MKTYFAKYLPVEETLKKDDYFINPFTLKPEKYIGDDKNIPLLVCKAKLFLCSRDIQVGDKARTFKEPSIERTVVHGLYDALSNHLTEPTMNDGIEGFKVIGEISPKAIWVKEGDEFIREDWRQNWESDNILSDDINYIEIFNSSCQHFH